MALNNTKLEETEPNTTSNLSQMLHGEMIRVPENQPVLESYSLTELWYVLTVALSSCESELYAANSVMCESIHLIQLLKFLVGCDDPNNSEVVLQKLYLDSSSAQAFIQRTGVGRMKHISFRTMFLQQLLREKKFALCRIGTKHNPGDLNTKRLSKERRLFLGRLIGLHQEERDIAQEDDRVFRVQALCQVANIMGLTLSLKGCTSNPDAGLLYGHGERDQGECRALWNYGWFPMDLCHVLRGRF